ncbi:class I tRNA ligase family protein, partial [Candidatus Pacearchaeota archaeon]|nr:class I tRNA ligase family protein [Candidatus Pacearchaeota archaeon]MBD3283372.1 class I tRNA ligase family protein [Candidatus Pacearchaeota archaeon]
KLIEEYFPADLVLEATEQTRLWFSLLQICSSIVFNKSSYENVYVHGMILDFQGMKMSKSLGNIISPYHVVDKFSSDIFRYYICGITAGENINFNWEDIKQKQRNLLVLMNIGNYLKDLLKQTKLKKSGKLDIEEKYILSRLNSTTEKVTELFEKYELDKTISEIEKLFLDLSRVYIKITRDKSVEKPGVVAFTIHEIYLKCLQMFSTICPLITEHLWQNLRKENMVKEESVHLTKWPKSDKKSIDNKLEEDFNTVLEVIEKGLAERDRLKIGLKWPLKKAVVELQVKLTKELQEIIKNQINVKELEVRYGKKEIEVTLNTEMTPKLEAEGYAREIIRKIQASRKKVGFVKSDKIKLAVSLKGLEKLIKTQEKFIKERVNANEMVFFKHTFSDKIKGRELKISFEKI